MRVRARAAMIAGGRVVVEAGREVCLLSFCSSRAQQVRATGKRRDLQVLCRRKCSCATTGKVSTATGVPYAALTLKFSLVGKFSCVHTGSVGCASSRLLQILAWEHYRASSL